MEHNMEEKMPELVLHDDNTFVDTKIILITSDEVEFTLTYRQSQLVELVKNALEHEENPSGEVKINVLSESRVFCHVLNWLVYHDGTAPKEIEKPIAHNATMHDVCEMDWDADFIDNIGSDRNMLKELMLAANYLNIPSLLELCCAKMATLIHKMTPNEMCAEFGTDTVDEKKEQPIDYTT